MKIKNNRQRLINMMYLVLLALLALNIQVDFIDAFFDLSTSIERTVNKLEAEKKQRFSSITEVYQIDSVKYEDAYKNSQLAINITEQTVRYIDSLQDLLIQKTGGLNKYGYPVNSVDPRISDKILIQFKGAKHLKEKLFLTKRKMDNLLEESNSIVLDSMYSTQNYIINSRGDRLSWEEYHFNNLALGGCLAILSGFKKDVKMMESTILNYYQNKIFGSLTSFIIPDIEAGEDWIDMAVMKDKVYDIGDKIRIDLKAKKNIIYKQKEVIILDEFNNEIEGENYYFEDGYLYYTVHKKGSFKVRATMITESGESKSLESVFNVENPILKEYIPADEMIVSESKSVLYVGVKNRLKISFPNKKFKDLKLKCSSGKLSRKSNYYYYIPSRTGLTKLTLYSEDKLISREFLVHKLPDPNPFINNATSGEISSKMFRIQRAVFADADGVNIKNAYQVLSFKMSRYDKNGNLISQSENNSAYFENDVLLEVRKAVSGDTFSFNKILVKSIDGRSRFVSSLILEVK